MRHYFNAQKNEVIEYYKMEYMRQEFEEAGLIAIGITPAKYRLFRDIIFLFLVVLLNVRYILNIEQKYPIFGLIFLILLYISLMLRKSFPIEYILKSVKSRFERKKNAEIFILQQLISNEYADKNTTKQNVYHMFLYMRRFFNYIRPAVDRFLEEYPLDPYNKEKAFKSFARIVGTPEAESLAEILYQIEQSSPEEVAELLEKKYEELKKKRQETYRRVMRDRGVVAYVLAFSGVMVVIICGLLVYYLEYKDLMNATYNMG
jgi:Ca2+/Na+ antiporter